MVQVKFSSFSLLITFWLKCIDLWRVESGCGVTAYEKSTHGDERVSRNQAQSYLQGQSTVKIYLALMVFCLQHDLSIEPGLPYVSLTEFSEKNSIKIPFENSIKMSPTHQNSSKWNRILLYPLKFYQFLIIFTYNGVFHFFLVDVPFFRLSFFSLNSWTGYKN